MSLFHRSMDQHDTVVADFIYDDIYLKDEPPYFEGIINKKKVKLKIEN